MPEPRTSESPLTAALRPVGGAMEALRPVGGLMEAVRSVGVASEALRSVGGATEALRSVGGVAAALRASTQGFTNVVELASWSSLTIRHTARAVGEVVREPDTTAADLRALAVELQSAVREVARQQAEATAAEPPGLGLSTYRWTIAGSLGTWVQVLLALLVIVQTAMAAAQPDPPQVIVVERPDPAEIERIVDERLREREVEGEAADDDEPSADAPARRGTDR